MASDRSSRSKSVWNGSALHSFLVRLALRRHGLATLEKFAQLAQAIVHSRKCRIGCPKESSSISLCASREDRSHGWRTTEVLTRHKIRDLRYPVAILRPLLQVFGRFP